MHLRQPPATKTSLLHSQKGMCHTHTHTHATLMLSPRLLVITAYNTSICGLSGHQLKLLVPLLACCSAVAAQCLPACNLWHLTLTPGYLVIYAGCCMRSFWPPLFSPYGQLRHTSFQYPCSAALVAVFLFVEWVCGACRPAFVGNKLEAINGIHLCLVGACMWQLTRKYSCK